MWGQFTVEQTDTRSIWSTFTFHAHTHTQTHTQTHTHTHTHTYTTHHTHTPHTHTTHTHTHTHAHTHYSATHLGLIELCCRIVSICILCNTYLINKHNGYESPLRFSWFTYVMTTVALGYTFFVLGLGNLVFQLLFISAYRVTRTWKMLCSQTQLCHVRCI